jgi:hypothetical protein
MERLSDHYLEYTPLVERELSLRLETQYAGPLGLCVDELSTRA